LYFYYLYFESLPMKPVHFNVDLSL
jgi:hypothetical protein